MKKTLLLLIFAFLLQSVSAQGASIDKSIQIDITMAQLTTLIKAKKYGEALTYFSLQCYKNSMQISTLDVIAIIPFSKRCTADCEYKTSTQPAARRNN